jgi:hypothetical protein
MTLPIRTAAQLQDLALPSSWTKRREARQDADAALRVVWQHFMDRGGPVPIDEVVRSVPDRVPANVRAALMALDEADLLAIDDGGIRLAYPFTTGPNDVAVEVAAGVARYACCAIDALGLAPMLGEPVTIRSRCHHCGESLLIAAGPDGPRSLPEVMVWVAPRDACATRVASGL